MAYETFCMGEIYLINLLWQCRGYETFELFYGWWIYGWYNVSE